MVIDKVRILACLNVIHVTDELEITTSSTHIPTAQTPVMDVENSREEASDNPRAGLLGDGVVGFLRRPVRGGRSQGHWGVGPVRLLGCGLDGADVQRDHPIAETVGQHGDAAGVRADRRAGGHAHPVLAAERTRESVTLRATSSYGSSEKTHNPITK